MASSVLLTRWWKIANRLRAGGTGIALAPCGFGARGALSSLVQRPPTSSRLPLNARFLSLDRPGASSRSVVSFGVSCTVTACSEKVVSRTGIR
jgi:hypothetical protein